MYDDLTDKQLDILNFIKDEVNLKGYPPSVREMCVAVGLRSTSTVHGHLTKLEQKGYIKRDATKPRTIELLERELITKHQDIVYVPIIGQVTAGEPILAVENIEDTFPLPINFVNNRDCYILSIKGDSMIDAGILDGDYVIVEKQSTAINGDIVVALVDEVEATVKRFFKEKDYIRLQPENTSMDPIIRKYISILGKVIGVVRRM